MKKTVVVFCTFLFIVSCSKNEISSVTGPDIEQTALTSGSWAKGLTGYTIYMDGGYATTLFSSSVSSSITTSKITNIRWVWNQLPSGTTTVLLGYTPQYGSSPTQTMDITSQQNGSTTAFNNLDGRGKISLKFTSTGGTSYPMVRTVKDSIIENYTY